MKQAILIVLGLMVVIFLIYLAFHSYTTLENGLPPRVVCTSQDDAYNQAGGKQAIPVRGTGSMAPYVPLSPTGDITAYVVASGEGYDAIKTGKLCIYRASWTTPPNQPVMHQAATQDADGWVMSGLNTTYSEATWRVNQSNFIAIVAKTYIWSASAEPTAR